MYIQKVIIKYILYILLKTLNYKTIPLDNNSNFIININIIEFKFY